MFLLELKQRGVRNKEKTMNLKFMSKNLDEEGLKVARDMLSKINPISGKS